MSNRKSGMMNILIQMDKEMVNLYGLPSYETPGSSGMDIRASDSCVLEPHETKAIPTGIRLAGLPRQTEIQIRSRSGLAYRHGVHVLNSPGTIDSDYRGEIKVIMHNTSDKPFIMVRGDRIAQMVLTPILIAELTLVEELDATERGNGGFGSTGTK